MKLLVLSSARKSEGKALVKLQPHQCLLQMWRIEEEKFKEEKDLHMKIHEGSQREDILNLKERNIACIVESLVT